MEKRTINIINDFITAPYLCFEIKLKIRKNFDLLFQFALFFLFDLKILLSYKKVIILKLERKDEYEN